MLDPRGHVCDRKREREHGAAGRSPARPRAAAVRLDEAPRDREAEAGALLRLARPALERLEDPLELAVASARGRGRRRA